MVALGQTTLRLLAVVGVFSLSWCLFHALMLSRLEDPSALHFLARQEDHRNLFVRTTTCPPASQADTQPSHSCPKCPEAEAKPSVATPTAPYSQNVSLVIPCQDDDWKMLPVILDSLAHQTMQPYETVMIVNLAEKHSGGQAFVLLGSTAESGWDNVLADNWKGHKESLTWLETLMRKTPSIQESLKRIRNLRLYVRYGQHFAGDNRVFGVSRSSNTTHFASLFDCDDFMHPGRIEALDKVFRLHPNLDGAIHGYDYIRYNEWVGGGRDKFISLNSTVEDDFSFIWPASDYYNQLPFRNTTWDPTDHNTEVNWPGRPRWWFPTNLRLRAQKKPGRPVIPHNGWITFRKSVLKSVPYPADMARGQDSLFNWRLLRNKKEFNYIPLKLGAYLRPLNTVTVGVDKNGKVVRGKPKTTTPVPTTATPVPTTTAAARPAAGVEGVVAAAAPSR